MDDRLGMGVLHSRRHLTHESQPYLDRQRMPITPLCNWLAFHQLHNEVETAVAGLPRLENLRDSGMIHASKDSPLRLDDFAAEARRQHS